MTNKEPSLKVRFILYPVIAGLFLLGCYFITLLAMGYNLKMVNGEFVREKTGSIILATRPGDAKVFLDGELYRKSTPIFSFFDLNIDRLPVGQHSIKIQKEGFETWQGNFEVKSGLVSWGDYILLLPRERTYSEYNLANIKQVLVSDDQTRAAVLTEDTENKIEAIHLVNTQNKNKEKIYEARYNAGDSLLLKSFSFDENRLFYEKKNAKNTASYAIETGGSGKIYSLFEGLKKPFTIEGFNPKDNEEFYIRYEQSLYLYNYRTKSLGKEIAQNVVSVSLNPSDVYFVKNVNNESSLWRVTSQQPEKVLNRVVNSDSYKTYFVSRERAHVILTGKTKELYLYKTGQKEPVRIASEVSSFLVTSNMKYLVYKSGDNLYSFELAKNQTFQTLKNRKIDQYVLSDDESNIFFTENGKLKMINYNGYYENEIANTKAFPFFVSTNYNLYFVSERADKKADLKVFSFSL